jgi:hypothetical protein
MTVLAANYAEGGTDGVAVTTGNSGGGSGTAFSAVTGSWTFSNVQEFEGALSYRSAQVGGTAQALQVPLGVAATSAVHTVAQYLTAFPASSFIVIKGLTAGFGASWRIDVTAAGLVRIRNSSNTQVAESVAAISINQWWRFKVTVVNSATVGSVSVDAYSGYSDTPSFTLTIGSINTATEHSHVQIGNSLSTPTLGTTFYDAYVADDTQILAVTNLTAAGGAEAGNAAGLLAVDMPLVTAAGGAQAAGAVNALAVDFSTATSPGGGSAAGAANALTVDTLVTTDSGGAIGAGAVNQLAIDVPLLAGSGGAVAAGAVQQLLVDTIVATGAGGGSAAGGALGAAVDMPLATSAGGAIAGPSGLVLDAAAGGDIVIPTSAGGGSAAGAGLTLTVDTLLLTGAGGGTAAGSTLALDAADVVVASTPGGAVAGSTPLPLVILAPAEDVVIATSAGGAIAGTSSVEPSDVQVVTDTMVMPILLTVMNCLQTEAMKVPNPPNNYQIRPGSGFAAMADDTRDECCEGIAWVRPGAMFETDEFPVPRTGSSSQDPLDYGIPVEMGIMRCIPIVGPGAGDKIPIADQWQEASQEAMDDAAALRRAICCLRELLDTSAVVAGPITPLENEATCGGQVVLLTIRVNACDCVDDEV